MIATRPHSGIVYDDSIRDMDRWLVGNPQALEENGLPPVTMRMLRSLRDDSQPRCFLADIGDDPARLEAVLNELTAARQAHEEYMVLVRIYRECMAAPEDDEDPNEATPRDGWAIISALRAAPARGLVGGVVFGLAMIIGLAALCVLLSAVGGK